MELANLHHNWMVLRVQAVNYAPHFPWLTPKKQTTGCGLHLRFPSYSMSLWAPWWHFHKFILFRWCQVRKSSAQKACCRLHIPEPHCSEEDMRGEGKHKGEELVRLDLSCYSCMQMMRQQPSHKVRDAQNTREHTEGEEYVQ